MLRVGLTGGLASGKSFVGHALADLGCLLIQADELGRQVEEPGGEAYDGIVREFGPEILNPDGAINRRRLAAVAFHDPERLKELNALVHPPVAERRLKLEEEFARTHPHGIAVTEAAILIETGSYREYRSFGCRGMVPRRCRWSVLLRGTILRVGRSSTGSSGRCLWTRKSSSPITSSTPLDPRRRHWRKRGPCMNLYGA